MITLIDFWAEWCGPCRQMKPVIDEIEKVFDVEVIDVDKDVSTVQQYNIRAVPTLILLKDGVEVERFLGVTSVDKIVETIRRHSDI